MSAEEILDNLKRYLFYHGTDLEAAKRIIQEGFKVWHTWEDGGGYVGGLLGQGLYITCNWRMALFFGNVLLEVTLTPGTRILDASQKPDSSVLSYLEREFGRRILTEPAWKSLPRNKQLTLEELISLFRYHYHRTWLTSDGKSRGLRWSDSRTQHQRLLKSFRGLLIRYGFHGYGHPKNDLGIVIFADDRMVPKDVIAYVPWERYIWCSCDDFRCYGSVDDIRRAFGTQVMRHGSSERENF